MDDNTAAVEVSVQHFMVEVAYALPEQQLIVPLEVEQGCTAREAVTRSGLLERFPTIDLETGRIGIFGKLTKLDTVLRAKDRVEIYRPLIADPKAVRKQRAAEGKKMTKGGGEEDESITEPV